MSKEKEIALDAVKQAVKIATKLQYSLGKEDILIKEDNSPVTIVDFMCQFVINRHLATHFPNDCMKSEESSSTLLKNEAFCARILERLGVPKEELLKTIDFGKEKERSRFWVLDPIDGTKGFIRKQHYSTGLALIENGKVVLGIIAAPKFIFQGIEGGIFVAELGKGAFGQNLDQEKWSQMKIPNKKPAYTYCEPHFDSTSHGHKIAESIAKAIDPTPKGLQIDSQEKYVLVAIGETAIYLRVPKTSARKEKIWDHAPGELIVEEAGGVVSDLNGKRLEFAKGVIMAENVGVIAACDTLTHKKALGAVLL